MATTVDRLRAEARRRLKGRPLGLPLAQLVKDMAQHEGCSRQLAWRALESMRWRGQLVLEEGRMRLPMPGR